MGRDNLSQEQQSAFDVAWKLSGHDRPRPLCGHCREIAAALLEARAEGTEEAPLFSDVREAEAARLRREAAELRGK